MNIWLTTLQQMSWLEGLAAVAGIVGVLYLQSGRILGYPLGILSVGIYIWIFYEAKVYAHTVLHTYYLLMNIYGWYHWLGKNGEEVRYGYCTRKTYYFLLVGTPLLFGVLYGLLTCFTDSDIAFWDALTTAFWIVAMWLMAHKRVECWIGWIIGDIICVPLYFYKKLPITSLQMLILLCIASVAFFQWKRLYTLQKNTQKVP